MTPLDTTLGRRAPEPTATVAHPASGRPSALPRLLRVTGAVILLAAASAFLFQRWSVGSDLGRYATLLALTAASSLTGLACGRLIRESKAARTLLAISLALTPVHFAVLGGLLYSRFGAGGPPGRLPAFGVWTAPSDALAVVTAGLALLALLPLVYLSARVLVPPRAAGATLAVFAFHLVLLAPWRASPVVSVLVLLSIVAALALEVTWVRRAPSLRTVEGRLVRLVWVAPSAIAIGRAHLYQPDRLLYGAAALGAGAALSVLAARRPDNGRSAMLADVAGGATMALGWGLIVSAWKALDGLWLPAWSLPVAGLCVFLSWRSAGCAALYRRAAAAVALGGAVAQSVLYPGVGASLFCLAVAIAILAYGLLVEQKLVLLGGVLAGLLALAQQMSYAVEAFSWLRWGALAGVGLATVLAAAVVERHQARLLGWLRRLGRRVRRWDP